jgi:hypothetical protein
LKKSVHTVSLLVFINRVKDTVFLWGFSRFSPEKTAGRIFAARKYPDGDGMESPAT